MPYSFENSAPSSIIINHWPQSSRPRSSMPWQLKRVARHDLTPSTSLSVRRRDLRLTEPDLRAAPFSELFWILSLQILRSLPVWPSEQSLELREEAVTQHHQDDGHQGDDTDYREDLLAFRKVLKGVLGSAEVVAIQIAWSVLD